ncbi:hypothetical protein GYMLUDRAFT_897744 [Collybiopsis luxurians FD-317 M1]|uniref:Uncharacterized protein n=1 Tax=Collybiopsis luxurians FD-317 M1 TaxID=944289 RepID=A0A0D0AVU0_9AGAR|nr:hypothetical protein GYMLUDRAFT_897744 [Collybiopsis luxurians FD-317 M1]
MVHLTASAVAIALGALNALNAGAAPVESRAESILSTCNNARLGVISGLNSTTNGIQALLQTVGNNDPATTSAANQAIAGLRVAQGGVSTIVKGVLGGVTPDASGVPAVSNGVAAAASALGQINSNDTNVQSNLATIMTSLNSTEVNAQTRRALMIPPSPTQPPAIHLTWTRTLTRTRVQ